MEKDLNKLDQVLALPIVECCDCYHCSRLAKIYIYRFVATDIYFYCWEDKGRLQFNYFIDCPYKSDWDDFLELTFEEVFNSVSDDYQEIIIFNLDLFR